MSAVEPATRSEFDLALDLSRRRVALLMGGRSTEREVSLWTGRAVGDALRGRGESREIVRLPCDVVDVEIEPGGRWRVRGDSLEAGAALARLADVDVFFSCLHGGAGEDGTIQGFLETGGRCYTGSTVRASAICMDKQATRTLAQSAGARVPPGVCFSRREWVDRRAELLAKCLALSRRASKRSRSS